MSRWRFPGFAAFCVRSSTSAPVRSSKNNFEISAPVVEMGWVSCFHCCFLLAIITLIAILRTRLYCRWACRVELYFGVQVQSTCMYLQVVCQWQVTTV